MATTREYLYSNFENFDKPTEEEFKVFIDFAGTPTTYLARTVDPVLTLLEDMNQETFILDVRVIYIITYGIELYFLFGLEGTYGLQGQEIESTDMVYVGTVSAGALLDSLTANTTIPNSGIAAGRSYPAGESFETILRELLVITAISNFQYTANDTSGFLNVGETLHIAGFTWTVQGEPANLHIADSEGQYSQDVSGSQQSVIQNYIYNEFKKVIWTLSGSNVDSKSFEVYWVEPTYYGRKATETIPDELEILAGSNISLLTSESITVPINTSVNEYGWIAVESVQTNKVYTEWEITAFNTSAIGPNGFMRYAGDVTVEGDTYNVYMYNYKSEVSNIKLF